MTLVQNEVDFYSLLGQTSWLRSMHRTLIHWLGIGENQVILDVGCALGQFTLQLAQRGQSAVGMDTSESLVERATDLAREYEIPNARFLVGGAENIPFDDHVFDLITCVQSPLVVSSPDVMLSEWKRVTKPQGQVIAMVPSDQLDPWTAAIYCEKQQIGDFERDSLVSFSAAVAQGPGVRLGDLTRAANRIGITMEEGIKLFNGLVMVMKLTF